MQPIPMIALKVNRLDKHNEQGLVLFVALIALVVMALASVALVRSVDTSSQIAANVTFKENASISANVGLEAMADAIGGNPRSWGNVDHAGDGYYATCTQFDLPSSDADYVECGGDLLTDEAQWTDAKSKLANGTGVVNGKDNYGNNIRYIIERMSTDGDGDESLDETKTLTRMIEGESNSSEKDCSEPCQVIDIAEVATPIYRITIRIEGVKNTVSYMQGFIS